MIFDSYDLQEHLRVQKIDHQQEIDELKAELAKMDAEHAARMAKMDAEHAAKMAEKDAKIVKAKEYANSLHASIELILGNVSDELIIKVTQITPEKLKELKLLLKIQRLL